MRESHTGEVGVTRRGDPAKRPLVNAVGNYFFHLLRDDLEQWRPLLSVYYLTNACGFRCPYCSDGAGQPYYRLPRQTVPGSRVIELFRIIRRHCDYLVITGGEPTEHPDFPAVINETAGIGFRGVILTTNGFRLGQHLGAVARSVSHLVVSLQTLDPAKGDASYGFGAGVHRQILDNLDRAARWPGRKFELILSSVVTPENIADLHEVYRYAQARGFRLAACPQLVGVKAHPALADRREYRAFYDFLIAEKKRGGRIQGTVDYLEHLRDLRKFSCRPFTMLVVSPTGDVFYPCLELGQYAGNLFNEPDLHRLRQAGRERFGPQPDCDTRCHSACALGFSRLLANPASALHEAALTARGWLRGPM